MEKTIGEKLTMYRTTHHSRTEVSQFKMLLKWKIRTRLSILAILFYESNDMDQKIHSRDAEKKGIWKYLADEKYQANKSLSGVAEGDKVLQKQRCKKMPSNFEAEPYKVVSKKRNNVTVHVIRVKLLMRKSTVNR